MPQCKKLHHRFYLGPLSKLNLKTPNCGRSRTLWNLDPLFHHKLIGAAMRLCKVTISLINILSFFFPKSNHLVFSVLVKKQNESIHLVIPTADIITFRQSIGKKVRELLELTKYSYAELKLTVITDLVSFNKKRDRDSFWNQKKRYDNTTESCLRTSKGSG